MDDPEVEKHIGGPDTGGHRRWIPTASDAQLDEFIQKTPTDSLRSQAIHEREMRSLSRLEKPHWVLWATLVATAIAAIAAVILLFR
jgi:hypothetical protein